MTIHRHGASVGVHVAEEEGRIVVRLTYNRRQVDAASFVAECLHARGPASVREGDWLGIGVRTDAYTFQGVSVRLQRGARVVASLPIAYRPDLVVEAGTVGTVASVDMRDPYNPVVLVAWDTHDEPLMTSADRIDLAPPDAFVGARPQPTGIAHRVRRLVHAITRRIVARTRPPKRDAGTDLRWAPPQSPAAEASPDGEGW